MANVLAKLAVAWLTSVLVNDTPIAMVASVLDLLAHFLNLLFP